VPDKLPFGNTVALGRIQVSHDLARRGYQVCVVTAAEFGIGKDLPDLFAMEVYDDQADILSVSRMDEYPRQCDSDIGIIYIDGIAVIYADKFAACFGYLPV